MADKISQSWIDNIYTQLTTTLANSAHNITSGISNPNIAVGDKLLANNSKSINELITNIKGLNSNSFLRSYAACFTGNKTLNNVTQYSSVDDGVQTQIEEFVTDILDICAHKVRSNLASTGNTHYGNNFSPDTGNTHCVHSPAWGFSNNNWRRATGNTHCVHSPAWGFSHDSWRRATGNTHCVHSPAWGFSHDSWVPAVRICVNNFCGTAVCVNNWRPCPNFGQCTRFAPAVGDVHCTHTPDSCGKGNTNVGCKQASGCTNRGWGQVLNFSTKVSGCLLDTTYKQRASNGNNFCVVGYNTESNCGFTRGSSSNSTGCATQSTSWATRRGSDSGCTQFTNIGVSGCTQFTNTPATGNTHCGFTDAVGNTQCSFTRATGNTHCGYTDAVGDTNCSFTRATGNTYCGFTDAVGDTNCSFSPRSGFTNYGNDFIACPTVRTDFKVQISSGRTISNSNFTVS